MIELDSKLSVGSRELYAEKKALEQAGATVRITQAHHVQDGDDVVCYWKNKLTTLVLIREA